eukprot:SAG31_NODE_3342_length_4383_cov_5.306723_2_plen_223_part_00
MAAVFGALKASGWPLRNFYNMATADPNEDPERHSLKGEFSGGPLQPVHGLVDYVAVQASSLPKIGIAIICYLYTVDMEAASKGFDFTPGGWVAKVVLRDLFLMVAVAGVWDWVLYFSPLKARLEPYKFTKAYPPMSQLQRDIFWTFSATLLASCQEVLLMRWWAGGALFRTQIWDTDFPIISNIYGVLVLNSGRRRAFQGGTVRDAAGWRAQRSIQRAFFRH